MLNMSNLMSNRNSTPDASNVSSLRPPSSRAVGASANPALRASADMAVLTGQAGLSRIRPSSDFFGQPQQGQGQTSAELDPQDKLAQQWIAEIDQYENTLEEMAAATLDQDFKDELSAIEQWFRVLSEAERTAALYALLQQTTQVQVRFFTQVLQQMGKNHPVPGVLSPANFDKDPMSTRLNDAMNKMNPESARTSLTGRGNVKRQSGLDSSTINAMFPDAAKAIATEKAKFTQQTGNPPTTNRNSAVLDGRNSLATPSLAATKEESNGPQPSSPWAAGDPRPKSASGHAPMGQFVQPPATGGLRSPRAQITSNSNIQNTTLTLGEQSSDALLTPYTAGGNWASMVNTPSNPNFAQNSPAGANNADMVANATAMKLAALSTVNNRFALDEVRKFRRHRSSDAPSVQPQASVLPANLPANIVMINENGMVMSREDMMNTLQQQQLSALAGNRSRPSSPGLLLQSSPGLPVQNYGPALAFTSPRNNGFLAAGFDGFGINGGMGSFGMGGSHEGYQSDHSDMHRGRSPRGRRATSRSTEDPTDPALLQDIPSWLRSLRLHKYTDNLKDLNWTELVELGDEQLEQRGVNALGARRKMLKVFEQVKEAKTTGKL